MLIPVVFNIMSFCRGGATYPAIGAVGGRALPAPTLDWKSPAPNHNWLGRYMVHGTSAKAHDVVVICEVGIVVGICLKLYPYPAQEFFDSCPYGRGATFPCFFPVVFNIMSFCRGGATYLAIGAVGGRELPAPTLDRKSPAPNHN